MRPRKQVVVYCADLVEAERISFILRTRKHLSCPAISRFDVIPSYPDALLVVVISLAPEQVNFQYQVDSYCDCPVLVWHRSQGATLLEFLHALGFMLVQKRGPKPREECAVAA